MHQPIEQTFAHTSFLGIICQRGSSTWIDTKIKVLVERDLLRDTFASDGSASGDRKAILANIADIWSVAVRKALGTGMHVVSVGATDVGGDGRRH